MRAALTLFCVATATAACGVSSNGLFPDDVGSKGIDAGDAAVDADGGGAANDARGDGPPFADGGESGADDAGPRLGAIVQITAGYAHTCALLASGVVVCWGANHDGQLGDGTHSPTRTPHVVPGVSGVVEVAAGGYHTCARTRAAKVLCWGKGENGQLGDGAGRESTTPRAASTADIDLSLAVALSAGSLHTCALLADGRVACWGANDRGQLGSSGSAAMSPVFVDALTDATSVAAGQVHTCVRRATGHVSCWGDDAKGQLGVPTNQLQGGRTASPVDVDGLFGTDSVALGLGATSCARDSGDVVCWGDDATGALGDPNVTGGSSWRPVKAAAVVGATSLSVGSGHVCAASAATTWCWGLGRRGQLGTGATSDARTGLVVAGAPAGVRQLALGYRFTCALAGAGAIWCWGENTDGQIGDGTLTDALVPVRVVGS